MAWADSLAFCFFNDTPTTEIYTLSLHDALPISNAMLEGLLRRELGFRGLVVTDAFDMGGLTEHFDAGEAAVRAIEAGEDQILMSPDVDAAIAALKAAVKSGRASCRERV